MRIIGYIEHPVLKVTVFKMNDKISLKLESGLYEQIYKFRSSESIDSLEKVKQLVDTTFLEEVTKSISIMHRIKMEALNRTASQTDEEEFEDII